MSGNTKVAPNMATTCWAPIPTVLPQASRWCGATASPGAGSTTSHLNIDMAVPFAGAPRAVRPMLLMRHPAGARWCDRRLPGGRCRGRLASVRRDRRSSAPPRVRGAPALRRADGPAPVLHRGPDAVYVDVAGRCVGVVGTRATAVPCALRTALRPAARTSRAPRCAAACCTSTTSRVVVGRLVDVRGARAWLRSPASPGAVDVADAGRPRRRADAVRRRRALRLAGGAPRAPGCATPEVDAAVRALAAARPRCCRRRCWTARCTAR